MREITVRELRETMKAVLDAVEGGESIRIKGREVVLTKSGAAHTTHAPARQEPAPSLLRDDAREVTPRAHAVYDTPAAHDLLRKMQGRQK